MLFAEPLAKMRASMSPLTRSNATSAASVAVVWALVTFTALCSLRVRTRNVTAMNVMTASKISVTTRATPFREPNIQHPTSNIEPPVFRIAPTPWVLDGGWWMVDVGRICLVSLIGRRRCQRFESARGNGKHGRGRPDYLEDNSGGPDRRE